MKHMIRNPILWGVAVLISFVTVTHQRAKSITHARDEARRRPSCLPASCPSRPNPYSVPCFARAHAIAVFTNVKKGGFIVGGTGGEGVNSRRTRQQPGARRYITT